MREEEQAPEAEEAPSKSELKRRMSALQTLGETLVTLNEQQLARIPIDDDRLLEAVREARQIRSNSARRRHLQYIGKLMRDINPAPIQRALDELHQRHQQANEDFHRLEQLRDDVLLAGLKGVELVVDVWPEADRQQLRQILLQHQRELKLGKPPAAARKLFRYLREQQDS